MTSQPDKLILTFVRKHHVMTLATMSESGPWCANAFYAFDAESATFVITSDPVTRHGSEMLANSAVAASIVLETRVVGRVQGLQIAGRAEQLTEEHPLYETLRKAYLKRFPYAVVAPLKLWALHADTLKYTDNTLGFGKKLIWTRDEQ